MIFFGTGEGVVAAALVGEGAMALTREAEKNRVAFEDSIRDLCSEKQAELRALRLIILGKRR